MAITVVKAARYVLELEEGPSLDEREDEQAVRDFLKGDRSAFDHLVGKYRARVYRLCLRFTGNHADADDQAQEAFLRAYRGLPRFRRQSRFSTWLYRITINTCLNWAAACKGRSEPLPEEIPDTNPGQFERLSRDEREAALREAIGRLPPKQRATLVLRVYDGLSHREISEIMESPVGTVKANFFFALQNLRKILEKAGQKADGGCRER
jgi:RNA polymerase sigma-70 factor (ECF subfamily)